MVLFIGIGLIGLIIFISYLRNKSKRNKVRKIQEEKFYNLVKNEYLPILSVSLFSASTICVDEEITTTVLQGIFVVQIHIDGPDKRLTLNCYINDYFELIYNKNAAAVSNLSYESIQHGVKQLRVDTHALTHA